MPMKPTFVIGDVHGHFDRLTALLEQEGIINAEGKRINHDVNVIQLGDLAHFGNGGSPTGDKLCYLFANDWFDGMCWGNHDRPLVGGPTFAGFEPPSEEVKSMMANLIRNGKLRMAHAANSYLLTHAGLHPALKPPLDMNVIQPGDYVRDAESIAEWINRTPKTWSGISVHRGGRDQFGGILWRDANEKLSKIVPQVFGHSRGSKVRQFNNDSYCVDVGTQDNGRLAGIWLPEMKVVECTT